ncbi:hypothetical protein CC85DRAFT_305231 [Cutaneotrichosporon oleaginosum]|uniref:Uncharacterized protein n=1 Tax=Cutaneotrichosporon oleaginosum TaxID=879819 RepID=A0A0J1AV79_9TREE|nr:uncharacterized protein CC85DRAFT_305231 [Cutaneotrichosporon oleaginosum]KLT39209.1 hypothetical protein CC85DRAFT_305231 [Cutaneotrichosporon oleaginosum]TXT05702.1 hypothetical protein COLE_07022 [Cutaneotrichosporon oleaginosum]
MRARPPSTPAAFALALALQFAAAQPVPASVDVASLYTVVDEETGETREKGLSSGIIAGVVVGAVLGFSILFGLLWCWLDRQAADRRLPDHPPRRLWPWAAPPPPLMHAAPRTRSAPLASAGPRTSSTSTTNTTSTGSRTVIGSVSSNKPHCPPSPPPRASRSRDPRDRDDDARRSDDSLPQYIQVHPPPKAVLVGPDHGRIGEWCAKAAARIEGHPVTRIKSWEKGDPEKRLPDPFTA